MENAVTYRPITDNDQEFLYSVYASTREAEMGLIDWDLKEKETFLRMQHAAQHRHYQEHFASAQFYVIMVDGAPAGRLYIDRRRDEIRIIDIALLPQYRGKGLGSSILKGIMNEGHDNDLPVRIHVEQYNPALRLYKRLGFKKIGDSGIYYLMEWRPCVE